MRWLYDEKREIIRQHGFQSSSRSSKNPYLSSHVSMLVLAGGAGVGVSGGGASSASLPRLVGGAANNTVVTAVGQTVYLYCGVTNLGDRQVRTPSCVPPVLLHENIENSESHFRRPKVVIFTFCILRNLLHEQLKLPVMFDFYSQFLFYFYFYIKQMKEIQMYIFSNY